MFKCRGLGRKRLRRRQFFSGHGGICIYSSLLDRPHGFACDPIEDIGETLFTDLGNGFDFFSVDRDVDQIRRAREIVIPDTVVNTLEMPDSLTGFRIEADETFREEVIAVPMTAVIIARQCAEWEIYIAEFVVSGH